MGKYLNLDKLQGWKNEICAYSLFAGESQLWCNFLQVAYGTGWKGNYGAKNLRDYYSQFENVPECNNKTSLKLGRTRNAAKYE